MPVGSGGKDKKDVPTTTATTAKTKAAPKPVATPKKK
jgi:hypothetical protein